MKQKTRTPPTPPPAGRACCPPRPSFSVVARRGDLRRGLPARRLALQSRSAADRRGPLIRVPRTLVVGCGFIGSHVVTTLAGRGEAPRVLTRRRPAEAVAAAVAPGEMVLGDAADPELLAGALEGIERVAYCAGGLLPSASERDPERDRELTMGPIEALLGVLRERPETTLVYLSSGGTVYGDPARLPAREDDPTVPISTYGRIHLACEEEIERARRETGLRSRILRCSTVYGEHQQPDRGQGAVVT